MRQLSSSSAAENKVHLYVKLHVLWTPTIKIRKNSVKHTRERTKLTFCSSREREMTKLLPYEKAIKEYAGWKKKQKGIFWVCVRHLINENVMCLDFVAFGGIFQIFIDNFYNFLCHSKYTHLHIILCLSLYVFFLKLGATAGSWHYLLPHPLLGRLKWGGPGKRRWFRGLGVKNSTYRIILSFLS